MRKNTAWNVRLRLVEQAKQILGAVLLSTLVSLPAWSAETEQRCQELGIGAACSCSETFDTASWATVGPYANPSNSTGSTECGGSGHAWEPASAVVAANQTGMPAGSTVAKVWRSNMLVGANFVYGKGGDAGGMKSDTQRVCFRHYLKLDANYLDNNQNAGKFMEMTWDGHHSIQYGSNGNTSTQILTCRADWGGVTYNCAPRSGALVVADLLGQWTRVEMCIQGDFPRKTGNFSMEGHYVRLSDGKRLDFGPYNMGPAVNPDWESFGGFWWIANAFRDSTPGFGCPASGSCNPQGRREISHAMQAEWPYQRQGLFIGPAYEIEGGSSGLPPTQPPVEQPPTTTESLGKPGQPRYVSP